MEGVEDAAPEDGPVRDGGLRLVGVLDFLFEEPPTESLEDGFLWAR